MVTVVGHRGAAGIAPENTVSSIERAVEVGADLVEFDVRETADGHLVVIHDASVDRTTDGTGRVGDLTLSEIRSLDAGDGERVPTLAEMLDAVVELGTGAYVELKEAGIAGRTVAAVEARGALSSCEFTAGDPDFLEAIAGGDVRIGGPVHDVSEEALDRAAALDFEHVGIHHEDLTRDLVDRIHERGMTATAWPVNERADVERVVALGVDAITTDRPDVVRSVLSE